MCVQLETNMTSLALDALGRQLEGTAQSLAQPAFAAERDELLRAAAALHELRASTLQPMLLHTELLNVCT